MIRCSGNWSSDIYKLLSEMNMTYSFENRLNVDISGFKALKHDISKQNWKHNSNNKTSCTLFVHSVYETEKYFI